MNRLLPPKMYEALIKVVNLDKLTELRIRINKAVKYHDGESFHALYQSNASLYIADDLDIDYIIRSASKSSLYAVNESLIEGFIAYNGGIRIGLCGEGVKECGKLITIKNIKYIAIRQPHQILNLADKLNYDYENPSSFIIVSPPGCGKTTLLRDMLRKISDNGYNCVLVDERYEISASVNGVTTMNIGENTDIMAGVPKLNAYQNAIRSMRPDFIFTDEIYSKEEVEVLLDAIRAGVKIGATLHGNNLNKLLKTIYAPLISEIGHVIELTDKPNIGTVKYEGMVCCH